MVLVTLLRSRVARCLGLSYCGILMIIYGLWESNIPDTLVRYGSLCAYDV